MVYTNAELEKMLIQLEPILKFRNKIGYVAARNYRLISTALTEYTNFKNDLIKELGTSEDVDGQERITLRFNSPNFPVYLEKIEPIMSVTQDVDIIKLKYEEVIGELSGEEIINLDWLLED